MAPSFRRFSRSCTQPCSFSRCCVLTALVFSILMFLSGVPTAEKPQAKKYYLMTHGPGGENASAWPAYKKYLRETSILLPIPRALYRPLPAWMKRSLLLDFSFFNFNERVDGPHAIEEARRKA